LEELLDKKLYSVVQKKVTLVTLDSLFAIVFSLNHPV